MLNENRSSLGAARCTRIHSPVRTWSPVFGSESSADGPPTCQYKRTSGKSEATDASAGLHRSKACMTAARAAWLFAPVFETTLTMSTPESLGGGIAILRFALGYVYFRTTTYSVLCVLHACAGVLASHVSRQPARKPSASSPRTGFVYRAAGLRHTPGNLRSRSLALCHGNEQSSS